jgi:hypothetical protein
MIKTSITDKESKKNTAPGRTRKKAIFDEQRQGKLERTLEGIE